MLNLMVVDDDNITRNVIERFAKKWGYRVYIAGSGEEGKQILKKRNIHIALLDWELPDTDGLTLSKEIRKTNNCNYVYIIFLTSRSDNESIIRGFEAGADDYISKPFNVFELKARVTTGARIIKLQQGLKRSQKKLKEIATHDSLTTLLNRRSILEIIDNEYIRAKRSKQTLGFITVDIDHFKIINDTYGHHSGDVVLKDVSSILKESLRAYDNIGRMGGEEFLAVLPNCSNEKLEKVSERLRRKISSHKFEIESASINVTISMGVTVYDPVFSYSLDSVLKGVDKALYRAKEEGRNRWIYLDICSDDQLSGGNYEKREH